MENKIKIVFFGTPDFAVFVLEEMASAGFSPDLIVTAPDRPRGRGLKLSPPPVKIWTENNNADLIQPEKLDENFIKTLQETGCELFVVAAYGKILPKNILEIPKYGVLNVHPSLLPKFRGSSPVESAILSGEKETGVSIMLLDEKMDHGPLLATKKILIDPEEIAPVLEERLARLGGKLLAEIIPLWVQGKINQKEQDHATATFTKKITKEDGLIDPFNSTKDGPSLNYRKYRAYFGWPGVYFFKDSKRIIIKEAVLENGVFKIKRVLREGGREEDYAKMG